MQASTKQHWELSTLQVGSRLNKQREALSALVLQGFDLELVGAVADAVTIPVIASSGAGAPEHFSEVSSVCAISASSGLGMAESTFVRLTVRVCIFRQVVGSEGAGSVLRKV